jgi:hypothetical protein
MVYVFNSNGLVFSDNFDHPIHTFTINPTGLLSVILQMDVGYAIYVLPRLANGDPIYRRYLHPSMHPGVIPLLAEKSEDGRVIAFALLDTQTTLNSKLQLAFTYRGDTWGTDYGIFFEYNFNDQLIMAMRMTSNNRLVVVTDAQVAVFTRDANDLVTKTATIPLHNQLEQLAFDGNGRFAVALGKAFLNAPEADPMGTVHMFNANGTPLGTYNAGRQVTHLSMGHGMAIIGADRNFNGVNLSGEAVWEFIALQNTQDFIFLENGDTVLIAGSTRADIWQRQRTRDDGDFFGIQGQQER